MNVNFDREQFDLLQEILERQLSQLRVESARTDGHDFRDMLHRREQLIEAMLAKLEQGSSATAPS